MVEESAYGVSFGPCQDKRLAIWGALAIEVRHLPALILDTFALPGGQYDKLQAILTEQVDGHGVDTGLRKPHPFSFPAESQREVLQAPDYLGPCLLLGAEGEYGVVETLSHGIAMAQAFETLFVRFEYEGVRIRVLPFQPTE